MQTKILQIIFRSDGKYDCDVVIIGSNKNQKVVLSLDEEDLKELNEKLQGFIIGKPEIVAQVEAYENMTTPEFQMMDEGFKDEVGGYHEGGIGWNPLDEWCGECTSMTCKDCVNENVQPKPAFTSPETQNDIPMRGSKCGTESGD